MSLSTCDAMHQVLATEFQNACHSGIRARFRSCLRRDHTGKLVNQAFVTDIGTFYPLYLCAEAGHLPLVRCLVNARALVNQSNAEGATALLMATQRGYVDVVKWLVQEGGANVDLQKDDGTTPIYMASQEGHLELVQWLAEGGNANVDIQADNGCTPLFIAAEVGHAEVVKFLGTQGKANVELQDGNGCFPLKIASQNGFLEVVRSLIEECHVKVDQQCGCGKTSLFVAVQNNHPKVVELLLKANADATLGCDSITPIHMAIYKGYRNIAKALVKQLQLAAATVEDFHGNVNQSAILIPDDIKAKLQPRKCTHCKQFQAPGEDRFDKCKRCRKVHYCSKECQRLHWKSGHKQQCQLYNLEDLDLD